MTEQPNERDSSATSTTAPAWRIWEPLRWWQALLLLLATQFVVGLVFGGILPSATGFAIATSSLGGLGFGLGLVVVLLVARRKRERAT